MIIIINVLRLIACARVNFRAATHTGPPPSSPLAANLASILAFSEIFPSRLFPPSRVIFHRLEIARAKRFAVGKVKITSAKDKDGK